MSAKSAEPKHEEGAKSGRVLVIDDDPDFAEGLDLLLTAEGYEVVPVHSAATAQEALQSFEAEVALIDIRLAGSSGINLIAEIRQAQPNVLCVMMTAFASTESAVEALQEGAFGYLRKPIHSSELMATLDRCFEHLRLQEDKRLAEESLRENEERLKQAIQLSGLGYWIWDAVKEKCVYCSEEYAGIHGTTPDDYIARAAPLDGEFSLTHPEDRMELREALKALRTGHEVEMEYRIITPGGEVRHVREIAKPIIDEAGNVIQEHGTAQDVTEQKEAEEQLRQAQKMEAIGQLTGGVAHDFNNLLAVIMGNAELVAGQLKQGNELTRHAKAMIRAAQRGAELTQRLLAFSRRQPLRPRAVDLPAMLADMTDMLSRTLGATIEVETSAAPDLWHVLADPSQMENAVLNLAINARDAMPDGGKLTIEIANIALGDDFAADGQVEPKPGEYVMLAIKDSGTGMPPEVLERVFEPFFTTKNVGDGSGLGLSMVYGFAKQSGGQIAIESEMSLGTAVRLYLPRAEAAAKKKAAADAPAAEPTARGETVLVIEDDVDVRSLAVSLLEGLGYNVVTAEDGQTAMARMAEFSQIDLLLSDVILPGGLSGPEIADEARRRDPEAKILFMSGYAEVTESYRKLLDSGSDLLSKPFHKTELAQKVRALLDQPRSGLH